MQLLLLSERHLLVGLDEDEGVEVVDVLDAVLDLVLGDLYQGAVLLLLHHGIHPVPSHPHVLLDLVRNRKQQGLCNIITNAYFSASPVPD